MHQDNLTLYHRRWYVNLTGGKKMILMNCVRHTSEGFTVYPQNTHRARLIDLLKKQLADTMRRIYCHEQTALFLYESLAAHTSSATQRDIFLVLAESEKRQLARRAALLSRLNASVPCQCQTVWGRFWQRFLLSRGPGSVLAYIEHTKRRDLRYQLKLIGIIRGVTIANEREAVP